MHISKLSFLSMPTSCTDVKANAQILYYKSIKVMTQAVINYREKQACVSLNNGTLGLKKNN